MPGKGKTKGSRAFVERAPIYDTTMIRGKDHKALEDLHRELYEEFLPVGAMEERLVQRLAHLNWEREQLYLYTQFKLEIRQAELKKQVPIAASVKRLKSAAIKTQLEKVSKEVEQHSKEVERYLSGAEGVATEKPKQILSEKFSDPKPPMDLIASLPDEPVDGRDLFFKLVEEFPILERLKQLEQVDVVIDRTIKRLMQLKTMKQMFRQLEPKVISPSSKKKSSRYSCAVRYYNFKLYYFSRAQNLDIKYATPALRQQLDSNTLPKGLGLFAQTNPI